MCKFIRLNKFLVCVFVAEVFKMSWGRPIVYHYMSCELFFGRVKIVMKLARLDLFLIIISGYVHTETVSYSYGGVKYFQAQFVFGFVIMTVNKTSWACLWLFEPCTAVTAAQKGADRDRTYDFLVNRQAFNY